MEKLIYSILAVIVLLGGPLPTLAQSDSNTFKHRIFFYIAYYNNAHDSEGHSLPYPQSFIYAAKTWEDEIKKAYSFDPKKDTFLEEQCTNPSDFIVKWEDVHKSTEDEGEVVEGAIFSHSSVNIGIHGKMKVNVPIVAVPGLSIPVTTPKPYPIWESGMEFAEEPGIKKVSGTVTQRMIDDLPKLKWEQSGKLILFGCNTAVMRGLPFFRWCPAAEFAKKQGVSTTGEVGFSFFSLNRDKYVAIDDKELYKVSQSKQPQPSVYLKSYAMGRNIYFHPIVTSSIKEGDALPTKTFNP